MRLLQTNVRTCSHSSVASSTGPDQWCVFCTPSLAVFRTIYNQMDSNLANLNAKVDNSGVSYFNNLMVARAREAFQVLHGSVDIIQVRWEMFIRFCSKFTRKTMCQSLSESPEFYRRYYKKTFGLFFPGHSVAGKELLVSVKVQHGLYS